MAHLEKDHFTLDLPATLFTAKQLQRMAAVHQSWEFEADRNALERLTAAGYQGTAAVELLERLALTRESDIAPLIKRHPSLTNRLAALRLNEASTEFSILGQAKLLPDQRTDLAVVQ